MNNQNQLVILRGGEAEEILTAAENQRADCCAIYNALTEAGHDEVAEVFADLDGIPTASEMHHAFSVAYEIERVSHEEDAFDQRHGI